METFYQVFGFVAAVVFGIIVLTTFFIIVDGFKRLLAGRDTVRMKPFINDGRIVNVHLSCGKVLHGVRVVGFTDQNTTRGGVPYPLTQMVVCETAKGARLFFCAKAVRVIEEVDGSA